MMITHWQTRCACAVVAMPCFATNSVLTLTFSLPVNFVTIPFATVDDGALDLTANNAAGTLPGGTTALGVVPALMSIRREAFPSRLGNHVRDTVRRGGSLFRHLSDQRHPQRRHRAP
jgi:hypothetical protein